MLHWLTHSCNPVHAVDTKSSAQPQHECEKMISARYKELRVILYFVFNALGPEP